MSTRLTVAGRYPVTLGEPHWERLEEKNGDKSRMALVIPCQSGEAMEYFRMYFSRQLISSGPNVGKSLYNLSAEQCLRLGVSEPFMPSKVSELEGKQAELVMDEEEYQGKVTVKPRYLNAQTRERLSAEEADQLWEEMGGKPAASAPAQAASTAAEGDEDELPW